MSINYTFIIPHKNIPHLLKRCVYSIPKREDIQILVVDDNSVDSLKPNVCRTDVEVLYLDEQESRGAGHARNIGIAHAKGEWLLFADSDDYYEDGFLDILDNYKNERIDVLYFNYSEIDANISCVIPDNKLQNTLSTFNNEEEAMSFIKYRNNTPWNKMVRRSFINDHKMYFEEVINGNDVLFSIFVAYFSKNVLVEPRKLYNYIKNTQSLTNKRQSTPEIQCRLNHIIKHNAFNIYIGHPEWNSSLTRFIITLIRKDILVLLKLPIIFWNICMHERQSNEWIDILKKNNSTFYYYDTKCQK